MNKIAVRVVLVIVSVVLAVSLSGCGKKDVAEKKEKVKAVAHVVTAKQKKAIMSDAKKAVNLLQDTRDETSGLELFLDSPLLEETAAQIDSNNREGKIKIRRLDAVKMELKNFTQGVAGVSLTYTDNGYYIDKRTGKKISEPAGKREKLSLALRETDGKWKIFTALSDVKPDWQSKDTTSKDTTN